MSLKAKSFLELDNELVKFDFKNYFYQDLMDYYLKTFNDPISKIISKYNLNDVNTISDDDAEFLSTITCCKSIFCKWLINIYLMFSSKTYALSTAFKQCITFSEMMFKSFEINNETDLSLNVFISLLCIMVKKTSLNIKQRLALNILEKLNQCKIKPLYKLHILYEFCSNNTLLTFFTKEQWNSFIDSYTNKNLFEKNEVYAVYDYFDSFLKFLSPTIVKRKKLLKVICDFIILNLDNFDEHFVHFKLPLIRDYLDELGTYSDETYHSIDVKIENANSAALKSLKRTDIKLPDDIINQFKYAQQNVNNLFLTLKENEKIDTLLYYVIPFDIEDIKNQIEKTYKSSLLSIIGENYLDENGAVINYKELNEQEQFSLDARATIDLRIKISIDLYYSPFYNNFTLDDETKKYIIETLNQSSLIRKEDVDKTFEFISLFFQKKYKESVDKLVISLESNLRKYLKSKGLNVYKRNGSHDLIDLNYIFNNNNKNSFRDCLLNIIDENYYFTLKWLLTDKYGFNLRNVIAHDLSNGNILESYYSIYASLQIIRLYFYFRD